MSLVLVDKNFFSNKVKKLVLPKSDITRAAIEIVGQQRSRTLTGKNTSLQTFKPYSPNSKKSGTPNLWDTGKMLNSVRFKEFKNRIKITTNNPYAQYHQYGTSKMPQRRWFGMDRKARSWANDFFSKAIKTRLEK